MINLELQVPGSSQSWLLQQEGWAGAQGGRVAGRGSDLTNLKHIPESTSKKSSVKHQPKCNIKTDKRVRNVYK